jgi:hypothetical protein
VVLSETIGKVAFQSGGVASLPQIVMKNLYLPVIGDNTVNFQMTIEEVKAKVREAMCGVDACNEENSMVSATPYLYQPHDGTIDELWAVNFEKTVEPSGRWSIDIDDGNCSVYMIEMPNPWYSHKR